MVFVPPSWMEGLAINVVMYIVIPLLVALIMGVIVGKISDDFDVGFGTFCVVGIITLFIMLVAGSVYWHDTYEIPSVHEKTITVKEWQPKPGLSTNEAGMMTIDNADELMLITTDDECFVNEENFYFNKFNTRDLFNNLKVGGTYTIKYYGWRCGFTSSFPNILSITKVVDESNATENKYSDYFGTKLTR